MSELYASISSEREISNLIAEYAFRNDDADIEGLGDLFAQAVVTFDGAVANGKQEFEAFARAIIPIGVDGRSATSHEITNLVIVVEADDEAASASAYWTLYRSISGQPRIAVMAGRYDDRFRRANGRWVFVSRAIATRWRPEAT
jgi:ketosteroid isomerase-like protein